MDRRTVWAILLMMVIAIVPAIFLKRPPGPPPARPPPTPRRPGRRAGAGAGPATSGPAAADCRHARGAADTTARHASPIDTLK